MSHCSESFLADDSDEDEMRLSDFYIGLEFWMSGSRWRCTDVGSRLVIAIKLDMDDDPSWYSGPPYAVCEFPIDEDDLPACSLTRYGGNSDAFTDEEVERFRNAGKADIVHYTPPPETRPRENSAAAQAEWRQKWEDGAPMRAIQDAEELAALRALRAQKAAAQQKIEPPPE